MTFPNGIHRSLSHVVGAALAKYDGAAAFSLSLLGYADGCQDGFTGIAVELIPAALGCQTGLVEEVVCGHDGAKKKGLDRETQALNCIGAPGEIRTPYPCVRSAVLYPDELRAHVPIVQPSTNRTAPLGEPHAY